MKTPRTFVRGKITSTNWRNRKKPCYEDEALKRSTYCFRHTYATFRLQEGVDVYFLAEQMGTSVKMIEDHYGHVNTIKHADRVLQGMSGWDAPQEPDDAEVEASKAAQSHDKSKRGKSRIE